VTAAEGATLPRVLVTGGNGFIGREVCRRAVEAGHAVVGLARRGRPAGAEAWMDRVEWVAADVLDPGAWRVHLDGCGAVIHCVGIIAENRKSGATFERVNGDSAIAAAEEAERAAVGAFVFISASALPPGVGAGYIQAKRRAEDRIHRLAPRAVILRPGFVYGTGRLPSLPLAALIQLATYLPVVGAGARGSRPLPVDTVARAALRGATDAAVQGVLDIDAIERLGGSA